MQKESIAFSDGKYSGSGEKLQPFKLKMLEMVSANGRGRVLDIGCGSGMISAKLQAAGWDVCGIDISQEGVRKYCGRGFAGIVSDAERNLPFKDQTFDAVWISEVIEHLVDYRNLLREIGRIVKKSGRVYLTTPNSVFYGYRLLYLLGRCPSEMQHPYHLRFFSPKFLCKTLMESGFRIEQKMGQNVYLMIPGPLRRAVERIHRPLARKFFEKLGFKSVDGLIHGEKLLLYRFSAFFPSLFSNCIMIVAAKEAA